MRILLTVHEFFPDFTAGTEVLTRGVARVLRDRGNDVRIFTGYPHHARIDDEARFDDYEYEGIVVTRFRYDRVPMGGQQSVMELEYDNRLVALKFRGLLSRFRPDVVHFFHLLRLSASPIDECVAAGVPTVLTPTDFWFVCPTIRLQLPDGSACDGPAPDALNCLRHLASLTQPAVVRGAIAATPDTVLRPLVNAAAMGPLSLGALEDVRALRRRHDSLRARLRLIDYIMAPTRLTERLLLREGVPSERIGIHRYGVAEHRAAQLLAPDSGTLVIAFIGTLAEQKGPHVVVDAIRRLGPNVDVRLDVYGERDPSSEYQGRLERLAGADPRIRFMGTFPNEQISEVLAGVNAVVVPSTWRENTPLVIYSAQAAGRPVIGSDVEGIAEVIEHERNGLLFPAGDVEALARQLQRLADDRALLARLSAAADSPKTTEQYVDEVERVYAMILERRAAA